jgi:hypothetical protein
MVNALYNQELDWMSCFEFLYRGVDIGTAFRGLVAGSVKDPNRPLVSRRYGLYRIDVYARIG